MDKIFVIILDVILISAAFFLSYVMRSGVGAPIQPVLFYAPFVIFSLVALLFSFGVFRVYGNHRPAFSFSYLVDFLRANFLWGAFIVAFPFFTKTDYSRMVVLSFFIFSFFLLFAARLVLSQGGRGLVKEHNDADIHKTLDNLVKISAFSSDDLALVDGVRRARGPSGAYFLAKRLLDITLSLVGLFFTLPLYPFIIYFIRKDSPGPVFISQRRVGRGGKEFTLYKFRTMKEGVSLYAPSPRKNDDERITKSGRLLRRHSLDELPQFWNVLLGDMSIVGPRPEMPFVVERYNEWQNMRLFVKPGITGIWQILGRKDIPLEENIEYDLYYVFHQSFFLDLAILLRTIPHLLFPKGAY